MCTCIIDSGLHVLQRLKSFITNFVKLSYLTNVYIGEFGFESHQNLLP